ncbi:MAG TPA: hypothetical protein VGL86_15130, partial [Polyangia bacterium]
MPFALAALAGTAAVMVACNHPSIHHGPIPCSDTNNVKCGSTCADDSDCGAGLYCATNKTCSADCVLGGGQCGSDSICDGNGRCDPTNSGGSDGGVVCPAGLSCGVACSGGGTTTISGKVYDPAGKNGLFNVAVYVPAAPLTALPKGVPTGADACSCAALFTSGAVVSTSTDETGSFSLPNAPVGAAVPLVIQ